MSGPDDRDTLPPDAANDTTELPPPIIPAGGAQLALSQALDELTHAFLRVESVAMALARQLDAQAAPEGT
jgi:hypothetical protein